MESINFIQNGLSSTLDIKKFTQNQTCFAIPVIKNLITCPSNFATFGHS